MSKQAEEQSVEEFVQAQLATGASEEQLRAALKSEGGWSDTDIDRIFAHVYTAMARTGVSRGQSKVLSDKAAVPESGAAAPPTASEQAEGESSVSAPAGPPAQPDQTQRTQSSLSGVPAGVTLPTRFSSIMVILVVAGLILTGGAVSAYMVWGERLLGSAPYTEENFIRGVLATTASIETATYGLTGSLSMEPRDAGARPFEVVESAEATAYREQYKRDVQRVEAVTTFMYAGRSAVRDGGTYDLPIEQFAQVSSRSSWATLEVHDPLTQLPYQYKATSEGADFALAVTFETDEVVERVRQVHSSFDTDAITVVGKTVTFTKDSRYVYLSDTLDKPFLLELSDSARVLPPELKASLSIQARSDLRGANTDGEVSIDGFFDMGDLTYRVAFDARKVDSVLYGRVRNLPGMFLVMLGLQKNEWFYHDLEGQADTRTPLPSIVHTLDSVQEEYRETAEDMDHLRVTALQIAEEERVVRFRRPPTKEDVDGEVRYRYDLTLDRDALVRFVTRMMDEGEAYADRIGEMFERDEALLRYLESDAYGNLHAYLNENLSIVALVDSHGFVRHLEMTMRVVPPDVAMQLADKQARASLVLTIDAINEPITIEAPDGAVPYEELLDRARTNVEYSAEATLSPEEEATASAIQAWLGISDAWR